METLLNKIFESNDNYDNGSCGSLIRTIKDFADSVEPYGVVAHDGDLVHIVGKVGDRYFDGQGWRSEDDIKADWAYDMDPELVQIVPVNLEGDAYVYNGKSIDADIIDLLK